LLIFDLQSRNWLDLYDWNSLVVIYLWLHLVVVNNSMFHIFFLKVSTYLQRLVECCLQHLDMIFGWFLIHSVDGQSTSSIFPLPLLRPTTLYRALEDKTLTSSDIVICKNMANENLTLYFSKKLSQRYLLSKNLLAKFGKGFLIFSFTWFKNVIKSVWLITVF